jgi:uncharacterized protein YjbI with pentapeptide repeats
MNRLLRQFHKKSKFDIKKTEEIMGFFDLFKKKKATSTADEADPMDEQIADLQRKNAELAARPSPADEAGADANAEAAKAMEGLSALSTGNLSADELLAQLGGIGGPGRGNVSVNITTGPAYSTAGKRAVTIANNADLSGEDFENVLISKQSLMGVDFSGADFIGAVIEKSNILRCDFSGANFSNVVLYGSNIGDCEFAGADFSNCTIHGCNINNRCTFEDADFSGVKATQNVIDALQACDVDTSDIEVI